MLKMIFAFVMIAGAAYADDAEDPALMACKRVIFSGLANPDGARPVWSEREVVQLGKRWVVSLPVRGTNAYGGSVKQTFHCIWQEGRGVTSIR